ncbi:MAG: LptF/LptG family permease [Planctomycetota bacterium]
MRWLRPGGHLDRYVARLFTMSYVTAFFLVVGLYVIIDLSVNLDEYLEEHADGTTPGLLQVMRYYGLHLPFLYLEMSPFVTLVAGLFAATRMVRNNEVAAALGAGVSSRRLFAPVYVGALVLAGGMFVLREWATGAISTERDELREYLLEQQDELVYRNLWVRDTDGRRVRVESYRPEGPSGGPECGGLLARLTGGEASVAIDAVRAYAPERVDGRWRWRLQDGFRTAVEAEGREREALAVFDQVDVGPGDMQLAWRGRERPLDLSFAQAGDLLSRDPDNLQYRTVRQYHLTFPLAGLVLLLVGLPFLVGQERGRGVERVAVGILLCMAYFAVDFVTRTLGLQGQIGPVYAAWFPLVLFGSLGVVLFGSMRS